MADQGSEIRPSVGQLADRVRVLVELRENRWALQQTLRAIWYCRGRVSSCNIYAVQQDTQCGLNE